MFTYNHDAYVDLDKFVDDIHENNIKFVPFIAAGIAQDNDDPYPTYKDGLAKDIFLKNQFKETITGRSWAGDTAYPDWFNSGAEDWWGNWLT